MNSNMGLICPSHLKSIVTKILKHISLFEYDLGIDENGEEKNGYDLARWLVNSAFDGNLAFPDDFKYELNTQNFTIEKHQVSSLFNNYLYFNFCYN